MMTRLAAVAFALALASSAQAMPRAPLPQLEAMVTPVVAGCGAGRTRVGGVCVARTTKRQVRRCARGGVRGAPAFGGIEVDFQTTVCV